VISSLLARVSAAVLIRGGVTPVLWLLTVPLALLALVYGAVMLTGPFDPLNAGTRSAADG
jgi:hypothetical protein